jgi:hypothetical protein
VDQKTGALEPTEYKADIAAPVCVRMMAVK